MLKYLKIGDFTKSEIADNELNLFNTNVVHLNQLIVNFSAAKISDSRTVVKTYTKLKNLFSIYLARNENRWQHLIETSLPHLHVFKLDFRYFKHDSSDEKLSKLRKFQTDLWHKQHYWYTDYEIDKFLASVYIPLVLIGMRSVSLLEKWL